MQVKIGSKWVDADINIETLIRELAPTITDDMNFSELPKLMKLIHHENCWSSPSVFDVSTDIDVVSHIHSVLKLNVMASIRYNNGMMSNTTVLVSLME